MIVSQLIEKAMRKAQGAQAVLGQSESTNVSFEDDKLKSAGVAQSTGMSVKVIVDGKIGSSYTTDIDDVDGVVAGALEAALSGDVPAVLDVRTSIEASFEDVLSPLAV